MKGKAFNITIVLVMQMGFDKFSSDSDVFRNFWLDVFVAYYTGKDYEF